MKILICNSGVNKCLIDTITKNNTEAAYLLTKAVEGLGTILWNGILVHVSLPNWMIFCWNTTTEKIILVFLITEPCKKSWSRGYYIVLSLSIALILATCFFGFLFPSIFEQRKTSHTADWHRPLILIDITMVGIAEFCPKTIFGFFLQRDFDLKIEGHFEF